ncbi:MAG TPA: hypothetical protein VD993_07175 [Chitinophagaceae bacterium]|nr:hypothetical protein [Chitinophagaceae bacterium]
MINEQINLALAELLKMNLGYADLSAICSFKNQSSDRLFRFEYSIDDTLKNKKLRNLISTTISDHAIKNECVVFHQANSIRIEKKII